MFWWTKSWLWTPHEVFLLSTGLTGVTGLTGAGHRSDRCSTGSKPCKFPLCVLVCFGSEGCLLVPRSSSTPVAAWAWPTWVVSRRHVLEAVFILLESPSPSRRIFIGSHSLPPSLVRRIGPSKPLVKTPKQSFDPSMSPETFAAFSKFHLSTSNSPNTKVV
jgi:hypothetical protein